MIRSMITQTIVGDSMASTSPFVGVVFKEVVMERAARAPARACVRTPARACVRTPARACVRTPARACAS